MNTLERIKHADKSQVQYLWEDLKVETPTGAITYSSKEGKDYILPMHKSKDEFAYYNEKKTKKVSENVLSGGYIFKVDAHSHELISEHVDADRGSYSVIKQALNTKSLIICTDMIDALKLQDSVGADESIMYVNGLEELHLPKEFHSVEKAYVMLPWSIKDNYSDEPSAKAFCEVYGNLVDCHIVYAPVAQRDEPYINFSHVIKASGIAEVKKMIASAELVKSQTGRFASEPQYLVTRKAVLLNGEATDIPRAITVKRINSSRGAVSFLVRFVDQVGDVKETHINSCLLSLTEFALSDDTLIYLLSTGIPIHALNLRDMSAYLQSFTLDTRGVSRGNGHGFRQDKAYSKEAFKALKTVA